MKRLAPALAALLLAAQPLAAQTPSADSLTNPVVMVIVLGAMALAPFVMIMLTSFVKIAVVLSILRNALGTQQVPPSQVITGLAFVLTLFVMSPVAERMYDAAGGVPETREIFSQASVRNVYEAVKRGREPLREFLLKHAHDKDRILFLELAARLDGAAPGREDFRVLIPAFVTSELKEAFQIGFLLFIPFIVVDMVVANVLLAMGMQMLSPVIISLPFKLLLFVIVDGWYLVVRGLVLSYAG
ncbi:MAG: flagellar type III secretion system pore protein FliP [Acidobacteria bacterium]|nr:flagellar type III secretion system pore protein FliP [Acidobacteriota bacterium]